MNTLVLLTVLSAIQGSSSIGETVTDFQSKDCRGKTHALSDYSDQSIVVIAFLGTECPLAKLYAPRLQEMSQRYAKRGVQFLGINSNSQDTLDEISAYARKHQISFPILKDAGNRIADQLQAKRTPEVFVLDKNRALRYWGRIDDQFGVGYARQEPTNHSLKNAIDQLLAGRRVEEPMAESVGCYISRVHQRIANTQITYSNQISRILQKNCVECHREGEIAPFSLTDYKSASAWADTMVEVVKDQRMPPWHANPKYGEFSNARVMSEEEKQQLFEWAAAGTPEGDPSQQPEPQKFISGWRLPREPDQIISMSSVPFPVKEQGTVDYQYFVVDPGFTEDKWISAAEVRPGNRAVVHHVMVLVRPPKFRFDAGDGEPILLATYLPGQTSTSLGDGQAKLVPAGSKFVFQMHYTPVGSSQSDLTTLGLVFADEKEVTDQFYSEIRLNRKFKIPPNEPNHAVEIVWDNLPENTTLHTIIPHMHLRGKAFRIVLYDEGQQTVLLDVPRYDFNWQHSYELTDPIALHKGMKIKCVAYFDNSAANLSNPNPNSSVVWGDQSWEEMAVAYFGLTTPMGSQVSRHKELKGNSRESQRDAKKLADRFIERFDKNQDEKLTRNEVPKTMAVFSFSRLDSNGDNYLSKEEVVEYALNRPNR